MFTPVSSRLVLVALLSLKILICTNASSIPLPRSGLLDRASLLSPASIDTAQSFFDQVPVIGSGLPPASAALINSTATKACQTLQGNLTSPASKVLYLGSLQYQASAEHYFSTSAQYPSCVFRPGSAQDLSTAIRLIAAQRIQFAISGGRHAFNPGFSSTKGIQIDMRNFNSINLSADGGYVDVGAGLVWDDVVQKLEGTGKSVLGGRATGVGVGGYSVGGGGFSWYSAQFGLLVSSIAQFDLVLPDGSIATASSQQNADLFYGIKGGGNQFGAWFNIRLKTIPRETTQVWGGSQVYLNQPEASRDAVVAFSTTNKDKRASLIPAFSWFRGVGTLTGVAFYDGPSPPNGTFAMFDSLKKLPGLEWGPTTVREIMAGQFSNTTQNARGCFATISLARYSPAIIDILIATGQRLSGEVLRSGLLFSLVPEIVTDGYGVIGGSAEDAGPWPHANSPQPLALQFTWLSPLDDAYYNAQAAALIDKVRQQAQAEGQNLDGLYPYPNYALASTSAQQLFGPNLDRLRQIKQKYDPLNTMRLATSFSF